MEGETKSHHRASAIITRAGVPARLRIEWQGAPPPAASQRSVSSRTAPTPAPAQPTRTGQAMGWWRDGRRAGIGGGGVGGGGGSSRREGARGRRRRPRPVDGPSASLRGWRSAPAGVGSLCERAPQPQSRGGLAQRAYVEAAPQRDARLTDEVQSLSGDGSHDCVGA